MPIYEYRCEKCGITFERLRKLREADQPVACPRCESDETRRVVSSFAHAGGCAAPARSRFR